MDLAVTFARESDSELDGEGMWKMLDLIAIPPTAIIYDTLMQQAANSAGPSLISWTALSARFGKGGGDKGEGGSPLSPGLAWKNMIIHVGSPTMFWKVAHLGVREVAVGPGLWTEFCWCARREDPPPAKLLSSRCVWDGRSQYGLSQYDPPVVNARDRAGKGHDEVRFPSGESTIAPILRVNYVISLG